MDLPHRKIDATPPLATVKVNTPISIVVPTFREAFNIPSLLERLDRLRRDYAIDLEALLIDDASSDGSVEAVEAFGADWARMIVRTENPGLSASVIDGMRIARHPVVVVMDADLSHPPEAIPAMILRLEGGADFVIGSRYVTGGTTDDDWGPLRWINSKIATALARPLTEARDPMAGFFALRRSTFDKAAELNPVGYKVGLELIVKCNIENVGEVPIHFADRQRGESKLTFKQQMLYLRHLRRLYVHRFTVWSEVAQFLVVGATGTVVNLLVLTLLELAGATESVALAGGIAVSVATNFLLNRRFTFGHARQGSVVAQSMMFALASGLGAIVNFGVALAFAKGLPFLPLQAAALVGIAAATGFNFAASRYVVFRRRHVKP